MWSQIYKTLTVLALILMLFLPVKSFSQIIKATGNATEASSQLIYYYGVFSEESAIQLTNTNDTVGVWVHVQIFRSYDANPIVEMVDPVRCEERNFIDFLTPNDTHVYSLGVENFPKNIGETEADAGESTAIDLIDPETKGFVIITPVVSESDLTAISFQHMIGTSMEDQGFLWLANAMGRDAVDLTTGEVLADGTTLDGVSTGFVTLQPDELLFDFTGDGNDFDVVGIAFNDVYGPAGLLGYAVTPSSATWTSFIFDFKEDPTSCGNQTVDCFYLSGLNETFGLFNEIFIPDGGEDNLLCSGAETPEFDPGDESNFDTTYENFGWTRMFVSGLGDNTNVLGFALNDCCDDAKWMNTDSNNVEAQATVAPTGISTRASSQLVYYYDIFDVESIIQVTNTNDTEPVTVHVQIFRSFDPDDDASSSSTADPVFCDERNFFDTLTPNDTHVYSLREPGFPKNEGETEADAGESTAIDLTEPNDSQGFVIITPVVSEADASAKSWQHLIGTTANDAINYIINAMGRDAVDLATGEILPDDTVLDGVTGGFVQLQPEELLFNFANNEDDFDVIGMAFSDVYGPEGLLGYNIAPATHTWTSFIFDFKEDPTSCGIRQVGCFLTLGLNETLRQRIKIFTQNIEDDLLCAGTETPEYDPAPENGNFDDSWQYFGWGRIFVSGIGEFDNHLALVFNDANAGADWMHVRGERTAPQPPEPAAEDCFIEGDEDEDGFADCLDTDCATDESCETGEEECADEMDNDEDGQTDCADLGCDGFGGCEFGEETSCDDGIDNDADGDVDSDDTDCQEETTGGGGDGGGCVFTGTVSTSSSVVNFLVLMLPFIGVFGIRRIRNRK